MKCAITPNRLGKLGNSAHRLAPAARISALAVTLILVPATLAASEAPVVDSLVAAPATVAPGETVTLAVEAHDPDCAGTCTSGCGQYIRADLTRWEADGGVFAAESDGVSGSPYSAGAEWQAPLVEATYTLTVELSDSGGFMCGGRGTTTADITVLVTTTTNQPPAIESLTASPAQLFPGGTSALACVATDPDGDSVTYSWATDAGTVTAGAGGAAVFTTADPALATVTCTATDPDGAFVEQTVLLSVTGAVAESALDSTLASPQRLAVDAMGDVYVADRRGGGIAVLHLGSGELVYRLPVPGVSSVAVDWQGRLLVGTVAGATVVDRAGESLFTLGSGQVSDVAVDDANHHWGVLYGRLARVVIYDDTGAVFAAFGAAGSGANELKSPRGLAVTPAGEWVVGDTGNGRIKVFTTAGALVRAFGAPGGGVGELVQVDDVAVDQAGLVYASDSFQDWVQVWNPDGTLREVIGTYGTGRGELTTAAGVAPADAFGRLLAASLNASRVEVFVTREDAPPVPAPATLLSATELTFAPQAVATTSAALTVVLTNAGTAPLGIRAAIVTGDSVTGDFAQTHDCGRFLDPGAGCAFSLTATPTAAGAFAGELAIDTSAGPLAVELAASGFVPPGVRLTPGRLDYSDQELGTTSPPAAVVLHNPGTEPLLISAITADAGYSQSNDCGPMVAGGGICVIQVVFVPDQIADHITGNLMVLSNAADSPHAVALDGRGIAGRPAFAKSFAPDSIISGGSSTLTFTVDNSFNLVAAGDLAFTDPLPAGLVIATPGGAEINPAGCGGALSAPDGGSALSYAGGTVAAGSICTISVEVTGTVSGLHVNTSGNLTSDAGSSGPASDNLTIGAVIPVTGFNDVVGGDGLCTLREAVDNANSNSDTTGGDCLPGIGPDVILLPAGAHSLTLAGAEDLNSSGDLDVDDSAGLLILGADARTTLVDGGGVDRVFDVQLGAALSLEGLTVQGGSAGDGGGGGIRTLGALDLTEVRVHDNQSPGDGGGLLVLSSADIRRCLFDANRADTAAMATGGAIAVGGTGSITIDNTTLSDNVAAAAAGGALSHQGAGVVALRYVTVTGNSSGLSRSSGMLSLMSSIVTGNGAGDCSGTITSGGYNTVGANGDSGGCPAAASDVVPAGAPGTVVENGLHDNGGPTDTYGVYYGSPAIDLIPLSVNDCGTAQVADQRGMPRADSGFCTAGAYEGAAVAVELLSFRIE